GAGDGGWLVDGIGGSGPGNRPAVAAVAALPVAERDVAGLVGADREGKATQCRPHRIDAGGRNRDRDGAEIARTRDPGVEPLDAAHDLVARAVNLGLARRLRAPG